MGTFAPKKRQKLLFLIFLTALFLKILTAKNAKKRFFFALLVVGSVRSVLSGVSITRSTPPRTKIKRDNRQDLDIRVATGIAEQLAVGQS